MRRPRHPRRIAAAIAGLALVATGVWWATSSTAPLDDAGDDGYLGLRLLLERRGATVTSADADDIDAAAATRFDTVFVLRSAQVDRDQLARWHRYVAAGGHLVLGEPDRPGPTGTGVSGGAVVSADDAPPGPTVAPGTCDLDGAATLPPIHHDDAVAHHVYLNETSCFGSGDVALVTSAVCRLGDQVTLSSPTLFANSTMGAPTDARRSVERRGNAALATRLFAPAPGRRVAIVTEGVNTGFGELEPSPDEPSCADQVGPGSIWQEPQPSDGSTRADGSGDGSTDGSESGADGSTEDAETPDGGDPRDSDNGGRDGDRGDGGIDREAGQGSENGGESGSGDSPSGDLPAGDLPSGELPSGDLPSGGGSGGGPGGTSSEGSDGDGATEAGTASPPPTIFDFLSPGLRLALAQLGALLVWYAWRRSRRRGVVVDDETPVELPAARRTEAVGSMRRRNGEVRRAAEELRRRAVTALAADVGLAADAAPADLVAAVARRVDRPPHDIADVIHDRPVRSEADLAQLGAELHDLRTAVSDSVAGRVAGPVAGPAGAPVGGTVTLP